MATVRPAYHGARAVPAGPSMTRNSPSMPPANGLKSRATYAPAKGSSNAKPQGPEMADFVEHNKKDSKGNLITKRYQKGQLLGKGGFAKCYQVTDVDTKEELACKVIAKVSLTKVRHKQKLQSEIKIHKSQNHMNIANFIDVFEDKDNVYIIMELCANQTMLELVKRKKRLTEAETRTFMAQIVAGVKHLHENNVIHRDLKLGNLFLADGDVVKIGDFGLACKLTHSDERKKTLCGTPNYIAPEVLESKNGHSFEVDTWSIGVVLYTCLVGKPPFETQDVKSTYKLIKSNTYSFPSHTYVSEKAKALVRKILVHQPEMRPSLGEILADPFFGNDAVPLTENMQAGSGKLKEALKEALNFSSTTNIAATRPPSSFILKQAEPERPPLHPFNGQPPAITASPRRLASSTSTSENTNVPSVLERNISNAVSCLSSANASPSKGSASTGDYLSSSSSSAAPSVLGAVPVGLLTRRLNIAPSAAANSAQIRPSSGTHRPSSGYNPACAQRAPSRPSSALLCSTSSPRSALPSRAGTALSDAGLSGATTAPPSATGSERPKPPIANLRGPAADLEDLSTLVRMHDWLNCAFSQQAEITRGAVISSGSPLPAVWVNQWVDYSKKYGMGYTLNDGRYGVFFNDATKILLGRDNNTFHYMERSKAPDGSKYDVPQVGKISKHGTELNKKVTLLDHFRNYLDDNKAEREPIAAVGPEEDAQVTYVRKWMRTKHSVIFRMSNNDFQVNFFDETEILLWASQDLITYKAKKKPRVTLRMDEVLANPEVAKRVKYVRDILNQLVSTMT